MKKISPAQVHPILDKYILADGYDMVVDAQKSHGSYMYDSKHNIEYLDFFSFFASMPLGFNHPGLNNDEFIKEIGTVALHNISNSDFYTTIMAEFVQLMGELAMPSYMKKMFFISGGALAVENGLKTAFDWKVRKNFAKGIKEEKGSKIIHFKQSFHGRTGYTLSMTNTADPRKYMYFPRFDWPRVENPKVTFPMTGKNLEDTIAAEKRSIAQIIEACEKYKDDIAGLIIEPIQGEGGDNHFRPEYMAELRRLA
ncbi:MAG TPA: aminotransferase class III-fold pyridoxal phosphate-dependent enzyme, partial [bacterium]|nr:aminotransferase class III-fold pyridoxal phosphate-dependent enzyme [bacterium]